MTSTHFNPPPAKRIKVQSDTSPHPRWLLVPAASRTVQDLLKSLLLRLDLPTTSTYDLCLDGAPILPDEDIALIRDGEQFHLRQRNTPSVTPTNSQSDPPHSSVTATPENITAEKPRKRRRVLSSEGKRRRNVRNRIREKRRRLERRQPERGIPTQGTTSPANIPLLSHSQILPSSSRHNPCATGRDILVDTDPPPPTPHISKSSTGKEQTERVSMPEADKIPSSGTMAAPSAMKETTPPSLQVLHRTPRPEGKASNQRVTALDGLAHKDRIPSPAKATLDLCMVSPKHDMHLPAGKLKPISLPQVPPLPQDDGTPLTKEPEERPSQSAPIRPCPSSHKPNPGLSYVFLQKVSIEPLVINAPRKSNAAQRNEHGNFESPDIQNTAALRPSTQLKPEESQAATGKTSGLIRVETTSSTEKQPTEEVSTETRKKQLVVESDSAESAEEADVAKRSNDASVQESKKLQAKSFGNYGDEGRGTIEITVTNAKTKNHRPPTHAPMDIDYRSVDNRTTTMPPTTEEGIHEASSIQQNCVDDPRNNIDPSKNAKPRRKRSQPQGKKGNKDKPDPNSKFAKASLNNEPCNSSPQRKNPDINQAVEFGMHASLRRTKKGGPYAAHEAITGAKSSECDVVNLIDDDECNPQLLDSLPTMHRSRTTENQSESTSPQSIVVPPVTTHKRDPAPEHVDMEVMKTHSSQEGKKGTECVAQNEGEQRREEDDAASARVSRRKSARPRRLKKSEQTPISQNPETIANVLSGETCHHDEENLETLKTLKQTVVRDLQACKPGASTQDKSLTLIPTENPVCSTPESGGIPNAKESSNPDVRSDAKKKQSALKGGLSTLAALRVAKAHAEIRLNASKDKGDASLKNDRVRPLKQAAITEQGIRTIDSEATQAKGATRKRSKRNKRSTKALRYLNEEQVNRSTFVGYDSRAETLLPPLELLELPEDGDDQVQNLDVSENPPKPSAAPYFEVPSDPGKEIQLTSQAKPSDNASESISFAAVTESIGSKKNPSNEVEEHIIEGPSRRPADDTGVKQVSKQKASLTPQNRESTDAHPKGTTTTKSHGSSSEDHRSTTEERFQKDLIHMLQNTTQKLAEAWSKWEECS